MTKLLLNKGSLGCILVLLLVFGCSLKNNIEKEEIVSFLDQPNHIIVGSWIKLDNLKDVLIDKDGVGKTWGLKFDSKFVYEFEGMRFSRRGPSSYTVTKDSNYMYIKFREHSQNTVFKIVFLTPDIIEMEIYAEGEENSMHKGKLFRIDSFPKNTRELHKIAKKNKRKIRDL